MIILHPLPVWFIVLIFVVLIGGMICRGINAIWEERQRKKYWREYWRKNPGNPAVPPHKVYHP